MVGNASQAHDVAHPHIGLGHAVLLDESHAAGELLFAIRAISRPSRVTRPASGRRRPARTRSSEDLPQPLGPSSPTVSPRGTRSETLLTMTFCLPSGDIFSANTHHLFLER